MKKITDENSVKAIVKDWMEAHGAWHYAPVQSGLGVHGIADRLGGLPVVVTPQMVGRTVAILTSLECKRPGRRNEERRGMSVHQMNHMMAIHLVGGLTAVVDGYEDLAELDRRLKELTGG